MAAYFHEWCGSLCNRIPVGIGIWYLGELNHGSNLKQKDRLYIRVGPFKLRTLE